MPSTRSKWITAVLMWLGVLLCLNLVTALCTDVQPNAAGKESYCIQIIVLSSRSAADAYVQELRQKGYDAFIAPMQTSDGSTKYRVRIGSFAREEEARKFGIAFSEKEKTPHVVVRISEQPSQRIAQTRPSVPVPNQKTSDNATPEEPEDLEEFDLPEERIPQTTNAPVALQHTATTPVTPSVISEEPPEPDTRIAASSDAVIKIFAYRTPDRTLTITNNYFSIPEQFRKDIQYLSIYPITVISYDASAGHIICMIDGAKKPVKLAGVCLPKDRNGDLVSNYIVQHLSKERFRLRYNPWYTADQGAIIGKLYTREGVLVNIEFVKNGLGTFCAESVPKEHHAAFKSAQEQARREKKGVWANH